MRSLETSSVSAYSSHLPSGETGSPPHPARCRGLVHHVDLSDLLRVEIQKIDFRIVACHKIYTRPERAPRFAHATQPRHALNLLLFCTVDLHPPQLASRREVNILTVGRL